MNPKIAIIAGSKRSGSHNKRLAMEAARLLGKTDVKLTLLDLADYPMPIYDGDDEAERGIHENGMRLAERIARQDGLLIVSPEYNSSVPPILKNAIDWASRVRRIEGRPVQPFKGLVVALASISPGQGGGMKGLEAWRPIMRSVGAEVITTQCAVPHAGQAFDEEGALADDAMRLRFDAMLESLIDVSRSLARTHDQF
ncbi:NAD(P)H-dependent oxidoreductase [Fulvimarina endophytica]|uniref:NAD(P)H-dependent oxidoreductase n=1 Tax=Fulvimarina endophytica TaxID=2293836 RepID=A0A371X531_9HYPH|nr:NAD(P)H-dependent oxidoreductase [Fulvimarina endophytica]RFC64319.1 NAD(P)H-dependent oxidoreductase [Fulvimarina endophytica]